MADPKLHGKGRVPLPAITKGKTSGKRPNTGGWRQSDQIKNNNQQKREVENFYLGEINGASAKSDARVNSLVRRAGGA